LTSNSKIRHAIRYELLPSVFYRLSSVLKGVLMDKKLLFSRLHKWVIANDPAVEAERFTEACFVERLGRRSQSRPISLRPLWLFSLFLCVFCAFLWLYLLILAYLSSRSVRICVNPWLINDLRLRKITYEKINLFLQNEPKFRKSQMNVIKVLTRDYEQMDTWSSGKNEPKTNPNKPSFKG
jgi:hypothetical protein